MTQPKINMITRKWQRRLSIWQIASLLAVPCLKVSRPRLSSRHFSLSIPVRIKRRFYQCWAFASSMIWLITWRPLNNFLRMKVRVFQSKFLKIVHIKNYSMWWQERKTTWIKKLISNQTSTIILSHPILLLGWLQSSSQISSIIVTWEVVQSNCRLLLKTWTLVWNGS